MTTFSIDDIRKWGACYDPERYLPKDWRGTALDIINNDLIPIEDRVWCVLRPHVLKPETISDFRAWIIEEASKLKNITKAVFSPWMLAELDPANIKTALIDLIRSEEAK